MTRKYTEKPLSISDTPQTGNRPPCAVLDTNVVLAACHFRDPAVAGVWGAITSGRLAWIGTVPMRDELTHVAARLAASPGPPRPPDWLADALTHLQLCPAPPAVAPGAVPRCTDPTDQMFIDLALAAPADWLFSRDRAVRKLAGRAGRHGVRIVTPDGWALPDPGSVA